MLSNINFTIHGSEFPGLAPLQEHINNHHRNLQTSDSFLDLFGTAMTTLGDDYTWENISVDTTDGYSLTLFTITGDDTGTAVANQGNKGPVLLMHRLTLDSLAWLTRPKQLRRLWPRSSPTPVIRCTSETWEERQTRAHFQAEQMQLPTNKLTGTSVLQRWASLMWKPWSRKSTKTTRPASLATAKKYSLSVTHSAPQKSSFLSRNRPVHPTTSLRVFYSLRARSLRLTISLVERATATLINWLAWLQGETSTVCLDPTGSNNSTTGSVTRAHVGGAHSSDPSPPSAAPSKISMWAPLRMALQIRAPLMRSAWSSSNTLHRLQNLTAFRSTRTHCKTMLFTQSRTSTCLSRWHIVTLTTLAPLPASKLRSATFRPSTRPWVRSSLAPLTPPLWETTPPRVWHGS